MPPTEIEPEETSPIPTETMAEVVYGPANDNGASAPTDTCARGRCNTPAACHRAETCTFARFYGLSEVRS
jgi:hypothetical protein